MTAGDKLFESIALRSRGQLLLEEGRLEEAKQALDRALDDLDLATSSLRRELVAGRDEVIRQLVGRCLTAGDEAEASGDPARARQSYEVGQALTAGTAHESEFRVRLARLDGVSPTQLDVPLEELARRVDASPDSAEALNDFATQLALHGHIEEAIVHLRRLTTLTPDDAETYFRLGNALADTEQFADAIRSYDKAQSLGLEDKAELEYRRGEVSRLGAGDLREAQRHYEAALALDGEHLESLWGLAHVSEELGRFETALAFLDRAKRVDPEDPGLHLHSGELFQKMGLVDKAREAFQRTLALDPDGVDGEQAQEHLDALDSDASEGPGADA